MELSRDSQKYTYITNSTERETTFNIKPALRLSFKAFKVVLETKNITVREIMQQYDNMEKGAWVTKSFSELQSRMFSTHAFGVWALLRVCIKLYYLVKQFMYKKKTKKKNA